MKSIIKRILCIVIIILLTGCGTTSCDKAMLKRQALTYFTKKYNIKESKIKVLRNDLLDKDEHCYFACDPSILYIEYENKEYRISYYTYEVTNLEIFADDYQTEEVTEDIKNYLYNKYDYISDVKIDNLDDDLLWIPEKYTGNFKSHLKKTRNDYAYNEITIWIQANSEEEAKVLNDKAITIQRDLSKAPINATIYISETSNGKNAFYKRFVNSRNYFDCKENNYNCNYY